MKIGIITWFTYENYGTKLQAVALQQYLRNLNHEVQLINFNPPDVESVIKNKSTLIKKIQNRYNMYTQKLANKKYSKELDTRSKRFEDIISENCILTDKIRNDSEYINICNQFDVLICGSDQIWNPNWYHPFYYADFKEIKTPRIAYAPSIGTSHIYDEVKENVLHSVSKFSAIGMREQAGVEAIKALTGKSVKKVVDPTLLLDKSTWEKILNIYKESKAEDYICCYFLGENKNHWKSVYKYAKKYDLKIKIIPQKAAAYMRKGTIEASAGIKEFVEVIANAKYVFTDSFHAIVFSVIFNKEFQVFERFDSKSATSQNSRIYNFLGTVGLDKQLITFNSNDIPDVEDINYKDVNDKLEKEIQTSTQFLREAIEKI